jgi:hypothetical protein
MSIYFTPMYISITRLIYFTKHITVFFTYLCIYLFIVYFTTLSVAQTTWRRMSDNELEMIRKEAVMT